MKDRQYINGEKKKRQTGINKNLQKKNSRSSNTAPFKTLGWIQVLQRNGGSNILGMKVKTDIRSWLLKFLVMGRWVMGSNTSHFLCKLCVILSQDLQFLVVSDSHYKKTVLDTNLCDKVCQLLLASSQCFLRVFNFINRTQLITTTKQKYF